MENNTSYIETIAKIKTQQAEFDTLVTLILNNCELSYERNKLGLKTLGDNIVLEYIKAVRPETYAETLEKAKHGEL